MALVLAITLLWSAPSSAAGSGGRVGPPNAAIDAPAPSSVRSSSSPDPVPPSVAAFTTSSAPAGMTLSIEAIPSTICVDDSVACNAQVAESQVTLRAQAPNFTVAEWPPVQVAFVIETTPYDGVYDPTGRGGPGPGLDACGLEDRGQGTLCEESNGVPFFVANAQAIANAVADANPHTNVSFAMVDYFATHDATDDDDGMDTTSTSPSSSRPTPSARRSTRPSRPTSSEGVGGVTPPATSTTTRTFRTTSSTPRRSPPSTGRSSGAASTGRRRPTT